MKNPLLSLGPVFGALLGALLVATSAQAQSPTAHKLTKIWESEAALKVPETGPIGLEGDRGQMEYRRIRVQEIP